MSHTVVGMFDNASDAQQAVDKLLANGFSPADIDNSTTSSSMSRENEGSSSSSYGTTSGDLGTGMGTGSGTLGTGIGSDLGMGTGTGTGLGMGTGVGSDYGTSRSGSDYGTGSNSSDYGSGAGTGAGAGIGSGISRFFKNLFGDNDDQVDKYSGVGQKAASIVTVYAQSDEQAERAADILDDNGAFDVDERAMQYGYGSDRTTSTNTDTTLDTNTSMEGAKSIPIIEEQLEVGKRTVQTGGARLRSRIIERPVEESVRLREERVTVERTPVDRAASSKDFDTFKEGTIELTESAEVPVVSKTARVVEEVSLDKQVTQREETISDTVRKTEVDVENIEKTGRDSQTGFTKNTGSDL